jgi:hypothetical protein
MIGLLAGNRESQSHRQGNHFMGLEPKMNDLAESDPASYSARINFSEALSA